MKKIDEMLRTGDRKAWKKFLDHSTLQEATLASVKAHRAGAGFEDMRRLAFLRGEHLNGEHRHPELWP